MVDQNSKVFAHLIRLFFAEVHLFMEPRCIMLHTNATSDWPVHPKPNAAIPCHRLGQCVTFCAIQRLPCVWGGHIRPISWGGYISGPSNRCCFGTPNRWFVGTGLVTRVESGAGMQICHHIMPYIISGRVSSRGPRFVF